LEETTWNCSLNERNNTFPEIIQKIVAPKHIIISYSTYLVYIFCTHIGRFAENVSLRFVGDVHDGDGVFVVTEADLSALVAGVWTVVDHTLRIVNIAVITKTTNELWLKAV